MISPKLQESFDNGVHAQLLQFVGNWQGTMKTYFDGPDPVNTADVTATIIALFDGRFIQHEYKSSFEEKPFEGIATYGYNMKDMQYECSWVDTFHTGTSIMFSTGPAKGHFNVTGSYSTGGPGSEVWNWRTEILIHDSNNITIMAYNIEPNAAETKALESDYTRIQ